MYNSIIINLIAIIKIVFKSDNQGQVQVLPPSLDELIPATYPVRVSNNIVDQFDESKLLESYKGGGNREIEVNHTLNGYKEKVRKLLNSEEGILYRKDSLKTK